MHYFVLPFILLFFSACTDDTAKYEAKIKELTHLIKNIEAEKNSLHANMKEKESLLRQLQQETEQLKEDLLLLKRRYAQVEEEKMSALQTKNQKEKLSKLGITVQENKITLDPQKTKDFFETFAKELNKKVKKVTEELQEGSPLQKDAGIQISESQINIDLNKTKDFLNNWGKKMRSFIKEFDKIAQEFKIDSNEINMSR